MKKAHLFCTKVWFYLCEIPPIVLLIFSIMYNNDSEGLLKLYPLIIFSVAAIAFVFAYFFRMIIISTEEIKCIGAFSSKDSALITKDKTLILTKRNSGKLVVRLSGKSDAPTFSWSQSTDNIDIDLFREKAIGGDRAISKILSYFDVPKEEIADVISKEEYNKEFENFILSKSTEDEESTVSIKFKTTI